MVSLPGVGDSIAKQVFLSFGDAKFAPIATSDIARVAASILANPLDHSGKSYDLFGSTVLSMSEIAMILSDVLGREVLYQPVDAETFTGILKSTLNASPYFIQHVSSLGQDLKDGRSAGMNDLVQQLTGQKPMTMKNFFLEHKNDLI